MKKQTVSLSPIQLVGLCLRTNNQDEMNPERGKIGDLVQNYFANNVAQQLANRIKPGVTYAVYTEFESDEHGEYTYLIGEAVSSFEGIDTDTFKTLSIPASTYQRFTTAAGKMPEVVINAWQKLWAMDKHEVGGERTYIADFEIYDERAADPNNTVIDIFIGVN